MGIPLHACHPYKSTILHERKRDIHMKAEFMTHKNVTIGAMLEFGLLTWEDQLSARFLRWPWRSSAASQTFTCLTSCLVYRPYS